MKLSKEARKLSRHLFQSSFTDGRLDESKVRHLLSQITTAKPRHYIDVLKNYQRLLRLEAEKRHAVVESAVALPPETVWTVEHNLKMKYGRDLTTEFRVNPELIGGLRVRIGSDVWDGSVRNRLERLEQQLAQA
jgi:F-type H+-transporting ATPase subunit delta